MTTKKKITVGEIEVVVYQKDKQDYISLTDMAKYRDSVRSDYIIQNWLRTRNAIEFCGIWEQVNNPNFNSIEFEGFKKESGANSFILTPLNWVKKTNAIGIYSKTGRYGGGVFAHKDIAFEFGSWLSPEFKFYLIREFQRLKEDESKRLNKEWNLQRTLAKVNYRIHTDAIKANLIPAELSRAQISAVYASEADLLNMALYGMTAREWRDTFPSEGVITENKRGNIRDYSTIEQLVVMSNLESLNAVLIEENLSSAERLFKLNRVAIMQMKSLLRVDLRSSDDLRVEEAEAEYKVAG